MLKVGKKSRLLQFNDAIHIESVQARLEVMVYLGRCMCDVGRFALVILHSRISFYCFFKWNFKLFQNDFRLFTLGPEIHGLVAYNYIIVYKVQTCKNA